MVSIDQHTGQWAGPPGPRWLFAGCLGGGGGIHIGLVLAGKAAAEQTRLSSGRHNTEKNARNLEVLTVDVKQAVGGRLQHRPPARGIGFWPLVCPAARCWPSCRISSIAAPLSITVGVGQPRGGAVSLALRSARHRGSSVAASSITTGFSLDSGR